MQVAEYTSAPLAVQPFVPSVYGYDLCRNRVDFRRLVRRTS